MRPTTERLNTTELLSTPVGVQLCNDLLVGRRELTDLDTVALYRAIVDAALSISTTDGELAEDQLRSGSGARRDIAPAVIDRLYAEPFFAATPTATQIWFGSRAFDPGKSWVQPLNQANETVRSKPYGGLWTSSQFPDGSSGWQPIVDSGYLGSTYAGREVTLQFEVDGASIARIDTAADWHELCLRFPFGEESALVPDWPSVAQAYAGVHLSPLGIVRAQDVPVTRAGKRTCLRGWDVEATVWLRRPMHDVDSGQGRVFTSRLRPDESATATA